MTVASDSWDGWSEMDELREIEKEQMAIAFRQELARQVRDITHAFEGVMAQQGNGWGGRWEKLALYALGAMVGLLGTLYWSDHTTLMAVQAEQQLRKHPVQRIQANEDRLNDLATQMALSKQAMTNVEGRLEGMTRRILSLAERLDQCRCTPERRGSLLDLPTSNEPGWER